MRLRGRRAAHSGRLGVGAGLARLGLGNRRLRPPAADGRVLVVVPVAVVRRRASNGHSWRRADRCPTTPSAASQRPAAASMHPRRLAPCEESSPPSRLRSRGRASRPPSLPGSRPGREYSPFCKPENLLSPALRRARRRAPPRPSPITPTRPRTSSSPRAAPPQPPATSPLPRTPQKRHRPVALHHEAVSLAAASESGSSSRT